MFSDKTGRWSQYWTIWRELLRDFDSCEIWRIYWWYSCVSLWSFRFGVRPSQSPECFLLKRLLFKKIMGNTCSVVYQRKQTNNMWFFKTVHFYPKIKIWWCKCYLKSVFLLNLSLCTISKSMAAYCLKTCIKNIFQIHWGSFVSCHGMDETLITFFVLLWQSWMHLANTYEHI